MLLVSSVGAAAREFTVRLAPAGVDRAGQVIAFALPAEISADVVLRDPSGRQFATQTDAKRTVTFVVPLQRAGEALTFRLAARRTWPPRFF